jgi:hypothetical protein
MAFQMKQGPTLIPRTGEFTPVTCHHNWVEHTATGVGWRAQDNCDLLLSNLDSLNSGANDLPFLGSSLRR